MLNIISQFLSRRLAVLFALAVVTVKPVSAAVECPRLSVVALLSSNVEKLSNQCVTIKGYLVSNPHWNPLLVYLDENSYMNGIRENSINVDVNDETVYGIGIDDYKGEEGLGRVINSYGEVRGTIRVTNMGNFNYISIDNVRYVQKLE